MHAVNEMMQVTNEIHFLCNSHIFIFTGKFLTLMPFLGVTMSCQLMFLSYYTVIQLLQVYILQPLKIEFLSQLNLVLAPSSTLRFLILVRVLGLFFVLSKRLFL